MIKPPPFEDDDYLLDQTVHRRRAVPFGLWAFPLFVIAALWTGCNQVLHRTPAEKAALADQDINWTFTTCQGMTEHAQFGGWTVRTVEYPQQPGISTYDHTAIKDNVTLTYHCGNEPTDPPQRVCFTWPGREGCASRPPRRM